MLARMDRRFDAIDRKFELVDRRFESIDRKFDAVDRRYDLLTVHHRQDFLWLIAIQVATIGTLLTAMDRGFHWL